MQQGKGEWIGLVLRDKEGEWILTQSHQAMSD
jgi:hypothetical protein